MTGEEIAGYRVERALGADVIGESFLVEHPRLPRRDVLTLLDRTVSGDAEFRAEFGRVGDVMASVVHSNIVALRDRGESDGRLWLATEHVDGPTAQDLVRDHGPLATHLVTQIVAGTAAAIDFMQMRHGVTHGGVAPSNIHVAVSRPGVIDAVKLGGFGLGAAGREDGFASPESIAGGPVDARSGQYSLARVALFLLSGHVPGAGSGASFGPAVDTVFSRALANDPSLRYVRCEEFAQALAAALSPPKPAVSSRKPWVIPLAVALLVAVVAAVIGGVLVMTVDDEDDPGQARPAARTPVDVAARAKEVAGRYLVGISTWDAGKPDELRSALVWHTTPEFGTKAAESADVMVKMLPSTASSTATVDYTDLVDDAHRSATVVAVGLTTVTTQAGSPTRSSFRARVTMDCTRDCLVSDVTPG